MATNDITNYLKFANLQMAAEALFDFDARNGNAVNLTPGKVTLPNQPLAVENLKLGNGHASKFPAILASEFAAGWEVVEHKSNTATGFSGTLFRYTGPTDESKGLVNGEQVISFRSTEFIDDAVRDNQVTNAMEIKQFGWAFGQIADMKLWIDSLYASDKINIGHALNVTGYSLGGHLAGAFNFLYPGAMQGTYTFNGAGVGSIKNNDSLVAIINQFEVQRNNESGTEFHFADATLNPLYADLRQMFNGTVDYANLTGLMLQAQARINSQLPQQVEFDGSLLLIKAGATLEVSQIVNAINRVAQVMFEGQRLRSVIDSGRNPAGIPISQVEAVRLDYQMAVLNAQKCTEAGPTIIAPTFFNKRTPGTYTIANFHEIYGDTYWSAVANSQYHYGVGTPIAIEDQPLWRGSVVSDAFAASNLFNGVKLLVNEFGQNDFGDTHSLVLLVDSLSVQNVFAQLDPQFKAETFSTIFRSASNLKGQNGGEQGKAEGDVLENILNALADTLGLNWQQGQRLKGNPNGNTWHEILGKDGYSGRDTFYTKLKAIQTSGAYQALQQGEVEIVAAPADGLAARIDFGALLSLKYLAPFALKGGSDVETALANANNNLYVDWLADKNLSKVERDDGMANFTDEWLNDRAKVLFWIIQRNAIDLPEGTALLTEKVAEKWHFEDIASQRVFDVNPLNVVMSPSQYFIRFGGDAEDTIDGSDVTDRLYGGKNNDIIKGGKGDDYIEGNEAGDVLYGGDGQDKILGGEGIDDLRGEKGNDTLYGGDGDDTLEGGAGADWLHGGDGEDTYIIRADDGNDTIIDSDGVGTIKVEIDGALVTLGDVKKDPGIEGRWFSEDKKISYSFMPGVDGRGTLTIKWGTQTLVVRDFKADGQFGLAPADKQVQPTVAPANTRILVDNDPTNDPIREAVSYSAAVSPWTIIGTANKDHVVGGKADDRITGMDGADFLSGMDGNDRLYADDVIDIDKAIEAGANTVTTGSTGVIEGGRGDDLMIGSASGYLYGGAGEDTVIGGGGDDVIQGDTFDGGSREPSDLALSVHFEYEDDTPQHKYSYFIERIDASGTKTLYARFGSLDVDGKADVIIAGGGSDIVNGEKGNDFISLGKGDDFGIGAHDADTVYGGEGNDLIFGDFNWDSSTPDGNESPGQLMDYAGLEGEYHGNDVLDGGEGDDTLQGNGGDDYISGGADMDMIWADDGVTPGAYHGKDYVDGGDGDDNLVGGGKDDELYGGKDNDLIWGDGSTSALEPEHNGRDYLDGGEGNDTLYGGGNDDKLFGGKGVDYLRGDASTDLVSGAWHGNDYLDGQDGNDYLLGDGGHDTLIGGDGIDVLDGDKEDLAAEFHGNDDLDGGKGDDVLLGRGGDDTLRGGEDNDELQGGDGADQLDGGSGNDKLFGEEGNDILTGGEGDDQLTGDGGNDYLAGGEGADQMLGDDGDDTLEGGAGNDVIFADAGNDVLSGDDGDDYLDGGDGNDLLNGGAGTDTLIGGAGDDTLDGGGGANYLDGGTGNNTYVLSGQGASADGMILTTLVNSGGTNIIRFADGTTSSGIAFQSVAGSDADFIVQYGGGGVYITNGLKNSTLSGLKFGDGQIMTRADIMALAPSLAIAGSMANDDIMGSAQADSLSGGLGNDVLQGGAGADTLVGGAGDDTYVFNLGDGQDQIDSSAEDNASAIDTIELSAGIAATDIVLNRTGNDLLVKLGASDSITVKNYFANGNDQKIDQITFSDGTIWNQAAIESRVVTVIASATAGVDHIFGTTGNDLIHGLDGNDVLTGNSGDDQLFGDNGADTLLGGVGNDTLDGGGDGDDSLYGGLGSDTYLFNKGDGSVRISETASNAGDVDTLFLGDGFLPASVRLMRTGSTGESLDLVMDMGNGKDFITITNFFARQDDYYKVEQVNFADGTVWTADWIKTQIDAKYATGTPGNDYLNGYSWDDNLDGAGGNDTLLGYAGNDNLDGGIGNDSLEGGIGNDTLDGGVGSDELNGAAGNDTYLFGRGYGTDRIWEADVAGGSVDTLRLNAGIAPGDVALYQYGDGLVLKLAGSTDELYIASFFVDTSNGKPFDNKIERMVFNDGTVWDLNAILSRVVYQGGANAQIGGAGNDTFVLDHPNDTVVEAASQGSDTVQTPFSHSLGANVENLTLTGVLNVNGFGNALNNVMQGNSGNNYLYGQDGSDTLHGAAGDDRIYGENGADLLYGGAGNDALDGGNEADLLYGEDGDDVLNGGNGADTIQGGVGNDTLIGGGDYNYLSGGVGDDTYYVLGGTWNSSVSEQSDEGIDTIISDYGGVLSDNIENLIINPNRANYSLSEQLLGNALDNRLVSGNYGATLGGEGGNDTLIGGFGKDKLFGGDGNDTLDGNWGNDTLDGGAGNDIYLLKRSHDAIVIADYDSNAGNVDTIRFDALTQVSDVKVTRDYGNLYLSFASMTGRITLQSWFNGDSYKIERIEFGDGSVWNVADMLSRLIVATPSEGADQIYGTEIGDIIHGLSGNDALYGMGGNDSIYGGLGSDTLYGHSGNDVYMFKKDDGVDIVYDEDATPGNSDTVLFDASVAPTDISVTRDQTHLVLTNSASGDRITLANWLSSDAFKVERVEFANGTVWTVADLFAMLLAGTGGDDNIVGTDANDLLQGLGGNDTLLGGSGNDSLLGGAGDDYLLGESGNDVYVFNRGGGVDTIDDYDATAGNLDVIRFDASIAPADVTVTRAMNNALHLKIVGGMDQIILAQAYADSNSRIERVEFNDGTVWTFADLLAKITPESATDGDDEIFGLDVGETLHGLDGSDFLDGAGGSDLLYGDAGDDWLAGSAGNDTLLGGAGNDNYSFNVGNGADVIDNAASDNDVAIDTLFLNVTSANATYNHIGNDLIVRLNASDSVTVLNYFATDADHRIDQIVFSDDTVWDRVALEQHVTIPQPTSGNDALTGSAGNDNIHGLGGNDTISGSGGNDQLFGDAGIDVLYGEAGNDTLDGGAGNDKLYGGVGDDYYVVDSASDAAIENASEGVDVVQSSVTWTLGANIENLILTGTSGLSGTGNALDNVLNGNSGANRLTGNAGNDTLDGRGGVDTMIGGAGNDTYVRDNSKDIITENANEGIDHVKSNLVYTLAANLEALTITGTSAINGTGNSLNNLLIGNGANNALNGQGGNDLLQGGAGNDTLTDTSGNNLFDGGAGTDSVTGGTGRDFIIGGAGNDTITTSTGVDVVAFNRGDGQDIVNASTGKDNTVSLGNGIKYVDLLFKKSGNNLILATGTSEQITFKDWYLSTNNRSVAKLQVVIEGTTDYNAESTSQINNNKIEQFNFDGLVTKFDQARAANSSLTSWALSSALLEFHLGGSDTAAIGGDLAYQYAKSGNLAALSMTPAEAILASAAFGTTTQNLQSTVALQDMSPRLM